MIVYLKILGGKDISVEIAPSQSVKELKSLIEQSHGIPIHHQKLLLKGKPLIDGNLLSSYGVTESTKINLVIKKDATIATDKNKNREATQHNVRKSKYGKDDFWKALEKVLLKRFNRDEVQKIITQYQKDYNILVNSLSLDDVERLAKRQLDLSSATQGS